VTLVIGTDEAGYGPNLGPLVVGGTAWRVTAAPAGVETSLAAAAAAATTDGVPLWGDSKLLYKAGAGLDALERGVLTAVALAGGVADRAAWAAACGLDAAAAADPPTTDGPAASDHGGNARGAALAESLRSPLAAAGVTVAAVRCRVVSPAEFNALLDRGLNKSDVLSEVTLTLAADLVATADADEPVVVWCDRHGGRRRYAPLVSRAFGSPLVQPLAETPRHSGYRFASDRTIEFTVGGEQRLPVAVASMTAKYVRELAMWAFNDFWRRRAAGLADTAGYPVDAARWRQAAAGAVAASGIHWDAIWRRA